MYGAGIHCSGSSRSTRAASLLFLALDEGFISEFDANALFDQVQTVSAKTAGLNRSLHVATSKTPFPRRSAPALDPRPSTFDT